MGLSAACMPPPETRPQKAPDKTDIEKHILDKNKENDGSEAKLILIVEDEFDLASTLSMLFELHGFRTLRANNGQQALELLRAVMPDLVLSDCMMPLMDGIALSRALRFNAETAHLPIILMSAAAQWQDLSSAQFNAFVEKPFQFAVLLREVDRLLSPS